MTPISEFDLRNMTERTERARNPKAAAAQDEAKREKFAAGQEKELQDQIEKYASMRGWFVVRPPMHKKSQLPKGYPDLTVFGWAGHAVLLEAKAEGGAVDPDQAACHKALRRSGALVFVVWNLEDAIGHLRTWLEP